MSNTWTITAVDEILKEAVLSGNVSLIEFFPTAFGVPLTTSGAQDSIVIDQDAFFILYAWNAACSQPAGTIIQFPDILVDVKNQGSGRYFSKSPMHWTTIFGNSQNTFYFQNPVVLPGMSNLQITLTNLSGASYNRVDVTWIGVKARSLNGFNLLELLSPADFAYTR